ncbi:MAG TPA: type II and III secretion system protein family protein [Bryobacteraceae bacterium]|nr:type II and III secretion system protein family protein [Bryobacteraceae bacterium]
MKTEIAGHRKLCTRLGRRRLLSTMGTLLFALSGLWAQSVEELRLTVGKSIVLDYPTDVRQISTSDPAIVDALAVSTREVLLHAKTTGTATVVIWSRSGQRTIYSITIEQNLDPLRRLLKETFPGEEIQIQSSRESVSLTGRVSSKETADRAVSLATPFGKTIVNNLTVDVPVDKQVLLKVKFAELNRNKSQTFGVNLISTGAGGTIGGTTTGQFAPPSVGDVSGTIGGRLQGTQSGFGITDALNVFAFRPDLNLGAFIKALESEGILQVLAEPNLVTTNGREASFLVGGEFPIPILQGGTNSGAVTVQFREFGIRLNFTPVLTPNNTIKMYVKPEVSTVDIANAVTVSGFLIPALATRRMETNIELGEGQSFVIAGLVDDRVTESMNRVPGLSNIPLLGALFKSREERKNRTELVVMVTPEITSPVRPGDVSIPSMPREFLQPLAPSEKRSAIGGGSQRAGAETENTRQVEQVDLSREKKQKAVKKTGKEPKRG